MYKYVIEDKNCMLKIPIECNILFVGLVKYKPECKTFVIESYSKLSIEMINRLLLSVKLNTYSKLVNDDETVDYTAFKSFEEMNYKLKKGKTND